MADTPSADDREAYTAAKAAFVAGALLAAGVTGPGPRPGNRPITPT